MPPASDNSVLRIPLERPASIKRLLPSFDDAGWIVSDFIVGEENANLRYLFDEATLRDLTNISPIVFFGEQATGKTALAITLAVRWARQSNLRPLTLTDGATYARDYAEAIEIDDIDSFRKRYRGCKLFALDDLDALATKSSVQTELSRNLDVLAEQQTPVILTSSKLPSLVGGLQAALVSRLAGGFSVAVEKPPAYRAPG